MKFLKLISTIISIGMVSSFYPMNSLAIEFNDEVDPASVFESEGVLPEGDNYKNLDFYEGEITYSDIDAGMLRSLPSHIDLSNDPCFPPLGDQGTLHSCVGFATTYYQFSYEVNKLNNVTSSSDRVIYSPKWTYNSINEGVNSSTYISDALIILYHYGALKLSDLPYDTNYTWVPGNTNLNSNEMIPERMEALETRISSFGSTSLPANGTFISDPSDTDLSVIKALLNNGKILTVATQTYFNYKDGTDHNNSSIIVNYRCYGGGGHVMAIVGYDDDVECDVNNNGSIEPCEKGAFKIANSLGTVGNINDTNGYKWVLYDALNEVSANTVNSWEQNLSGTRVQALRTDTSSPTFWYMNVSKYSPNYIGEIEINTGNYPLSSCQYVRGRGNIGSNANYINQPMLPVNKGAGSYNGKIIFDYNSLCTPISSYLSGYNWYVYFTSLYGTYNFKVVDNKNNLIANYGNNNNTIEKSVNISTLLGDVNYSGGLSQADGNMIQQYLLHSIDFSNLQLYLADCNQDGSIDMGDVVYIIIHS